MCKDIQALQSAVETMDCLSQAAFAEIASIARLALARLETSEGHRHIEDIALVLRVIQGTADDTRNCINCEAEQVGCTHKDEALARRRQAARQEREGRSHA